MKITALVPAYNEAESIANTIYALIAQDRVPDEIIVIPNGCSDDTAEIARRYPVTVYELPKLKHKKSEALNKAWNKYARDSDIVVCLDADTVLPRSAVADWENEFRESVENDTKLGGSSSKFTVLGKGFWTRLQRAEFAKWSDTGLMRNYTTVLSGTGSAFYGPALLQIVEAADRNGPWSYDSQVEDFELTYRLRQGGWKCYVSPTVRAYTDSMKSVRSLWGQRMKWQVGTLEDLFEIGLNRLTLVDWWQQIVGIAMAFVRLLWIVLLITLFAMDELRFVWLWWVGLPLTFAFGEFLLSRRIPHVDCMDRFYAISVIPNEVFAWLRTAWIIKSWQEVIFVRLIGVARKDRWTMQYDAEYSTPDARTQLKE